MTSFAPVLLVEDDGILALGLARMLTVLGYANVHVAATIEQTEDILATSPKPDIAILDYALGNGETTTELGQALAALGTYVVYSSGYDVSLMDSRLAKFPILSKPAASSQLKVILQNQR